MRCMLYVPILHSEADMGIIGPALARETRNLIGELRWKTHCRTVEGFWKSIASYLEPFDPRVLKLYQDGMPADGPLGKRIVDAAAARGSENYQLLLKLIEKGAELRKTEDSALLTREGQNISLAFQAPKVEGPSSSYRLERDFLMDARDRAIAQAVNSTLRQGEVGVLFLGAGHDVSLFLEKDIQVEEVKSRHTLRAYLSGLISGNSNDLETLSANLISGPAAGKP